MSTPSLFQQHINANLIDLVAAGEVKARLIGTNFNTALGASTLGAGSIAIIMSSEAAILAHVPADASNLSQNNDGDTFDYVREMMEDLNALYLDYLAQGCMSSPVGAVIVCGMFHNTVTMPHHVNVMIDWFEDMGICPSLRYYYVSGERDVTEEGNVLVKINPRDGRPQVIVDDSSFQTLPPA